MPRFLRWIFIIGGILVVISAAVSFYAHFLVDYSLETLGYALEASQKPINEDSSPLSQKVYRSLVQDALVDEASSDHVDIKNLTMLDMAARSFDDAGVRAGNQRAGFYLEKVISSKTPNRNYFLAPLEFLYTQLEHLRQSFLSFFAYIKRQINKDKSRPVEYSSLLLLTQAEEKEGKGDFNGAADLYRKYLNLYHDKHERGFVSITLVQLLMKQKKFAEAQKILGEVESDFAGEGEGYLAGTLLKKIRSLKDREAEIEKFQKMIASEKDHNLNEQLKFHLGLAYMSSYQYEDAEKIFKELGASSEPKVRQQAKFYLGLVYKFNARYDQGVSVLLDLLDDKNLEGELELALRVQLADIYYQKHEVKKSLAQYHTVSTKTKEKYKDVKAVRQVWEALSEMQQVNIYFFDLKDTSEARAHLDALGRVDTSGLDFEKFGANLQAASKVNLMQMGFQALTEKKMDSALNFFTRNLKEQADDAWTNSGIATIYAFLGDMDKAMEYAQKGKEMKTDEYTASVLAYLNGLFERYPKAIELYQAALKAKPDYIPARFNLGYIYLKASKFQEAIDIMAALNGDLLKRGERFIRSKTLNNLGVGFWSSGDIEKARENFRQAILLTPHFKAAEENLDRLILGEKPKMVTLNE